jgi:hypothetical protein
MTDPGTPPPAPPTPAPDLTHANVRIQGLIEDRNGLASKLAAAQAEVKQLKTGDLARLQKKLDGVTSDYETAKTGWERDRMWLASPFKDPASQAAATAYHGGLPEDGRPTIGEWVQGLESSETASADFPLLAGYLGGDQPRTPPPQPPPPVPMAGGANGAYSREAVSALLETATKSGDWTAYNRAIGFAGFGS